MKDSIRKEKIDELKMNTAQLIIGKNGITPNFLNIMRKKIKKDKILKVKILKTASGLAELGRKEYAQMVATKVGANLIEVRGYNFILQKKEN
ncbi:MAG: YhbY family RNA-binding protein [Candidatus Helarchaeota archaeon]